MMDVLFCYFWKKIIFDKFLKIKCIKVSPYNKQTQRTITNLSWILIQQHSSPNSEVCFQCTFYPIEIYFYIFQNVTF